MLTNPGPQTLWPEGRRSPAGPRRTSEPAKMPPRVSLQGPISAGWPPLWTTAQRGHQRKTSRQFPERSTSKNSTEVCDDRFPAFLPVSLVNSSGACEQRQRPAPKSYHHRKARSMIRAAILTALLASPAMAQQVCLPEPQIEAGLSQRYGETVFDTIEDEQGVWELWGNPESGTWTVTLTRDGTTCVMRAGEGFVDPATPQGEQM